MFGYKNTGPKGAIIVDGQEVGETLQCVHCAMHWQTVKGSGRSRGFCMHCFGTTCGAKACDPCIPFEKRLEDYEKYKRAFL